MLGTKVNVPDEGIENHIVVGRAQMLSGKLLIGIAPSANEEDDVRWVSQSSVVRVHDDGSEYRHE